ncbi:hypothetical protein [Nocardia abscessus]|uniref:hypothetical protein n=1 Tax=Nocardia abscessus TaxID=120957 RepID=UPI002456B902|nr:hypothetical protein [Nocardia abscessus]
MGDIDRPDDLNSSEREQYFRYAEGKIGREEIPRNPAGWLEKSAFFRTLHQYGRAFERGLDVVYGLPEKGYQAEVPYKDPSGNSIRVDRFLPRNLAADRIAQNIEAKAGRFGKDRDIKQLRAYRGKLARGEVVRYFIRESREGDISREAKARMAELKEKYPHQFFVLKANEKVFQRIMEAGVRQVEKDRVQRLQENFAKIPAREVDPLRVEQLAKDYVLEIQRGKEEGRPVGIEQLRFMNEALRDLAAAELKLDLERADKDRRALGLRYHESREVERFLEAKAADRGFDRAMAIDHVTLELIAREREEVTKTAVAMGQWIEHSRQRGRVIDPDLLKQQHAALVNTLGAVQKMETELVNDVAQALPQDRAVQWISGMALAQEKIDAKAKQQIDNIREAAQREEKERGDRESANQQQAQERITAEKQRTEALERLHRQGIPLEVVQMLGIGQAQPPQAAVKEPPGQAPQVQRGYWHSQDRSRGIERGL